MVVVLLYRAGYMKINWLMWHHRSNNIVGMGIFDHPFHHRSSLPRPSTRAHPYNIAIYCFWNLITICVKLWHLRVTNTKTLCQKLKGNVVSCQHLFKCNKCNRVQGCHLWTLISCWHRNLFCQCFFFQKQRLKFACHLFEISHGYLVTVIVKSEGTVGITSDSLSLKSTRRNISIWLALWKSAFIEVRKTYNVVILTCIA